MTPGMMKERRAQMDELIDFIDDALYDYPSERAYELISDRLANTDLKGKYDAYLVLMLRLPYPYHEEIDSYKDTFQRVWKELQERGKNPRDALLGLPIDKYKPT